MASRFKAGRISIKELVAPLNWGLGAVIRILTVGRAPPQTSTSASTTFPPLQSHRAAPAGISLRKRWTTGIYAEVRVRHAKAQRRIVRYIGNWWKLFTGRMFSA